MTLSDAARSAWAKTGRGEAWAFGDGAPLTHWLPLHQHLSDAAGIAARLWDEGFWAPKIRARLAQRYGGNEATARALAILIAENHDVGKASPAFAAQCAELTHEMAAEGLKVRQEIADHPDRSAVRHELVSYVAFLDWVEDRGSPRDVGQQLASVLGMHHGRPLLADRVRFVRGSSALAGEGLWKAVRNELLDRAANNAEVVPYLEQILATPLRKSDLVLLSGMLVLTDWIASSEAYFPLFELESNTPVGQEARVAEAWRRFSPAPGWHPGPVESAEQLFGDI